MDRHGPGRTAEVAQHQRIEANKVAQASGCLATELSLVAVGRVEPCGAAEQVENLHAVTIGTRREQGPGFADLSMIKIVDRLLAGGALSGQRSALSCQARRAPGRVPPWSARSRPERPLPPGTGADRRGPSAPRPSGYGGTSARAARPARPAAPESAGPRRTAASRPPEHRPSRTGPRGRAPVPWR